MGRAAPSEEQLWGYLMQLTSALRAAHGAGLLLRPAALMPSKLLLTSPGRIRVGARFSAARSRVPAPPASAARAVADCSACFLVVHKPLPWPGVCQNFALRRMHCVLGTSHTC